MNEIPPVEREEREVRGGGEGEITDGTCNVMLHT